MAAQQNAADRAEATRDWRAVKTEEERRRFALEMAVRVQRLWTAGDVIDSARQIEEYIKTGNAPEHTRSGPLADKVHAIAAEVTATRNALQAGEDPEDIPVAVPPPAPDNSGDHYIGLDRPVPEARAEDGEEIPF